MDWRFVRSTYVPRHWNLYKASSAFQFLEVDEERRVLTTRGCKVGVVLAASESLKIIRHSLIVTYLHACQKAFARYFTDKDDEYGLFRAAFHLLTMPQHESEKPIASQHSDASQPETETELTAQDDEVSISASQESESEQSAQSEDSQSIHSEDSALFEARIGSGAGAGDEDVMFLIHPEDEVQLYGIDHPNVAVRWGFRKADQSLKKQGSAAASFGRKLLSM